MATKLAKVMAMVLGHQAHSRVIVWFYCLITWLHVVLWQIKKRYIYHQFHKSYGHQTQQGSDLWHEMTTQKILSPLVKSPFYLWYFFYHKIVPLILHRATTRLVLLVRKQELPILTFGRKNSSMNKAKFLGDSVCKIWSSNFINAVSQKRYWSILEYSVPFLNLYVTLHEIHGSIWWLTFLLYH